MDLSPHQRFVFCVKAFRNYLLSLWLEYPMAIGILTVGILEPVHSFVLEMCFYCCCSFGSGQKCRCCKCQTEELATLFVLVDIVLIFRLESLCLQSDVRKAYRKLAVQYHPDKNKVTKLAVFTNCWDVVQHECGNRSGLNVWGLELLIYLSDKSCLVTVSRGVCTHIRCN